MIDKVDEAHIKVLEEFKVEKIWNRLRKRGRELGLSEYVVNKGIMITATLENRKPNIAAFIRLE